MPHADFGFEPTQPPPTPPPPDARFYRRPRPNGYAVAALSFGVIGLCGALGLLGVVGFWACPGLLGIVFGRVARQQIAEHGEAGRGQAAAGIVLGWISVAATLTQVTVSISGDHPL